MSRAMNISMPEEDVRARCEKDRVAISAIETLASGGTHLVCINEEGAEAMRRAFKSHIITGPVRRFAYHRLRAPR